MTVGTHVHLNEVSADRIGVVPLRIREARQRAGIKQNELARMLGISHATLSGYETGKHQPTPNILKKIAEFCGTSVDLLYTQKYDEKADADGRKIAELLNERRKAKGISYEELNLISHIPDSTAKKILTGVSENPSFATMSMKLQV